MKGTDSTNLPPRQSVLLEKIYGEECNFKDPNTWPLEENGWLLENGHYTIKWFSGQQVPDVVTTHIDESLHLMHVDQDNCSSSDESGPDSDNE